MPRRSILSAAERESLLALPATNDELIRHYTFSESDLPIINQRRGAANRLGFAVQLCYLRFPAIILGIHHPPFPSLLKLVADQLKVAAERWIEYGQREQMRRNHLVELQTAFGFQVFAIGHDQQAVRTLTELAMQTDKGNNIRTCRSTGHISALNISRENFALPAQILIIVILMLVITYSGYSVVASPPPSRP
jgi:hypothetical protein